MKKNSNQPEESSPVDKFVSYSYRMGSQDYHRITKHIRSIKKNDSSKTEQKWIEDAFKDKLKNDTNLVEDDDHRDRHLYFKLNSKLNHEIAERVELIRKNRISFSKRKWFLEAIFEKLTSEQEGQETGNSSTSQYNQSLLHKLCNECSKKFTNA